METTRCLSLDNAHVPRILEWHPGVKKLPFEFPNKIQYVPIWETLHRGLGVKLFEHIVFFSQYTYYTFLEKIGVGAYLGKLNFKFPRKKCKRLSFP